jgi:pseudaminic acid synthase
LEWQPKLKEYAESLGLICFSSPFDKTSVDFLEKMNVPAYKIASFEITDIPLIEYVASKRKPIIISTGIATLDDIQLAINTCKKVGNEEIILLKCTSSYPTPLEEINLLTIPDMKDKFDYIIGLSDHTLGISVPPAVNRTVSPGIGMRPGMAHKCSRSRPAR